MKRILSAFLIIALSVILLASCAKNTFNDITSQLDKYSFKRADYEKKTEPPYCSERERGAEISC